MPIKHDILYPIFLECCQYAVDDFWFNVFEDLSYGKTPIGTYISKGFLYCTKKDNSFSYKIPLSDPKTVYEQVYRLLDKKLGLLSDMDVRLRRECFYKISTDIGEKYDSWASIKQKNIRDLLIEEYVINNLKKYRIDMKKTKYLMSTLAILMSNKKINSSDIQYNQGTITSINGIEFEQGRILVNVHDTKKITFTCPDVAELKPTLMSGLWGKYLEQLKKKSI